MSQYPETNPHFNRPLQHEHEGQGFETPPSPELSQLRRHGQESMSAASRAKGVPQLLQEGQRPKPQGPRVDKDQPPSQEPHFQTPWLITQLPQNQGRSPWIKPQPQDQGHDRQVTKPHQQYQQPSGQGASPPPIHELLWGQNPRKTPPIAWFIAVFCAISWIVIFLGGLIIVIVYLVYRPRSPSFNVSSVTLNAAYIDAGSLLNVDLSVLANFTNLNKKASVNFHYMILDLYYGNTLIATQYIEPFSAVKAESRYANVHMITNRVRLSLRESQRLQEQMNKNGVVLFDIKGMFQARSNLGSFLRYSYRLYGHCTILVTAPPSGVLRATKCRTKR